MTDDYNGNGTFRSASGQVWNASFQMNGSMTSFKHDGPTSGSLDSALGAPTITLSGSRQKECNGKDVAMTATAFDAAGLFLGAIGIAPAAVVCGVIGVGLGIYGWVACN